jgi:hypothetical protein
MPRRTITVTHLFETVRYRPDERVDLDKLPTGDLLYTARALFDQMPKDHLVDQDKERYVAIESMEAQGRTLLFNLKAGPLGVAGEVRDSTTHQIQHAYDESATTAVSLRAMLVVPRRSRSALFFVEHGGFGAGGGVLLAELKRALRHWHRELTVKDETIVEAEAWLAGAELMKATAMVYGHHADLADHIQGMPQVVGRLQHTILPERGQRLLPRRVYDGLVSNKVDRAQLFGIRPEDDVEDVNVTMTNNGREKTFALGEERFPTLRLLLSDAGDPEPSSEAFRDFVLGETPDLLQGVGVDWQSVDASGQWPKEAFDVEVEVPPR